MVFRGKRLSETDIPELRQRSSVVTTEQLTAKYYIKWNNVVTKHRNDMYIYNNTQQKL